MKSFKIALLFLVLTGAYSMIGADGAVKAAPGAILHLYSITGAVSPAADAEPITIVVDKGENFSYDNLKKIEETQKFHGQGLFLVWKGFVNIPSPGEYTFSASFLRKPNRNFQPHILIKLADKDLLSIFQTGRSHRKGQSQVKLNDSRSVTIPGAGDYELTVIYRAERTCYDFTFQMWSKDSPLKKLSITPAMMVHAE